MVGNEAAVLSGLIAAMSTPPLSRDSAPGDVVVQLNPRCKPQQRRLSPSNIPRGNVAFFADGNLLTRKEEINV